jgi:excisionase family DNA binding protein
MLPSSWQQLTADAVPDQDVVEALGIIGSIREKLRARLILSTAKPTVPQSNAGDRLLTVAEVAERLQVSPRWVYNHADKLPGFVKVGRQLRFSEKRLQQYIDSRR